MKDSPRRQRIPKRLDVGAYDSCPHPPGQPAGIRKESRGLPIAPRPIKPTRVVPDPGPGLSDEEWIAYLRANYPKGTANLLIDWQKASANARLMKRMGIKRKKRKLLKEALRLTESQRLWNRSMIHAFVLCVSGALAYHTAPWIIFMFGVGVGAIAVVLTIRYVMSSVSAFLRRLARTSASSKRNFKLDRPRWDSTRTARLLNVATWFLPPEYRSIFVEEQCGNLAAAASRREWLQYLLDLDLPRLAWTYYSERKRESAK